MMFIQVVFIILFINTTLIDSFDISQISNIKINALPRFINTNLLAVKSPSANDKIRIKLLVDVKNTGRKGDVVFISPQMWTNLFSIKKLGVKMSDEEVSNLATNAAAAAAADLYKARVLQEKIASMDRMVIVRKVGIGRNLFGSVTHKQLIDLLKEKFPENVTTATSVIITDLKGDFGVYMYIYC